MGLARYKLLSFFQSPFAQIVIWRLRKLCLVFVLLQ